MTQRIQRFEIEGLAGLPVFDIVDYGAAVDGTSASPTDDTAAIQATVDAVAAAGGGHIISSKPGVCLIAGPLRDTAGANAQLLLPSIDAVDSEQITIVFEGSVPPPTTFSVIGATPTPDNHLVLKSTLNAGSGGAVIGGRGPAGTFEGFTNLFLQLKNLTVRLPSNPVLTGLNLAQVTCVDLDNVVVDCGNYYVQGLTEPTTTNSYGIRLPANNNGAYTRLGAVNVIGFYTGYQFAEHTVGQQVNAWGCQRAFEFVATNHASKFQRLMAVHCPKGMVFTGTHYVDVDQFNIEHATSGWWVTTADVDDPSNYGHGAVTWHVVKAGVGIDATFTKNGATGITANRVGTAPAAGSSTVYKGRDRLVAAAGDNTLTLGATAVAKSELVWVNGTIKWPSTDYTISGAVITFTAALAAGDVVSVVYDTLTTSPAASTLSHPVVGVTDNFNRADSATSLGFTSTGAVAWQPISGTWGIVNNKAYVANGVTGSICLAAVETGLSDCTVSVKIAQKSGTTLIAGLYLRGSGVNDHYVLEMGAGATGTTSLYKKVGGGAYTVIGSIANTTFLAGDVMTAVMSGNNITVKKNGTTLFSVTDSAHATKTMHGLYNLQSGGGGAAFGIHQDDFSATE